MTRKGEGEKMGDEYDKKAKQLVADAGDCECNKSETCNVCILSLFAGDVAAALRRAAADEREAIAQKLEYHAASTNVGEISATLRWQADEVRARGPKGAV